MTPSPSVKRWRSFRAYMLALDEQGKAHPATIAAYARACEAWGVKNVRPSLDESVLDSMPAARARLRAAGAQGFCNRSIRKAIRAVVK